VIAYVNCLCGFGVGTSRGACLDAPDPNVNHVAHWEASGRSPITHYVISFLSFGEHTIVPDAASVWATGGEDSNDFELDDRLRDAMRAAQAHGKKVLLSLGGESGSARFLDYWRRSGATTERRVRAMRTELTRVAQRFERQNRVRADGFDVDIELGGAYTLDSDKYAAVRDLINAVPDALLVAFAPQVSNGLCAAPNASDALAASAALGGGCEQPARGADMWPLVQLDRDCTRADGSPKLEYFGIQYYNAGDDVACGGGDDTATAIESTAQHYVNLANGWPASSATDSAASWPAFGGLGAQRVVLGKPGCRGCAGSNYLDMPSVLRLIARLDQRLAGPMGGVLIWDLCRMLGRAGGLCIGGCQPSWGGADTLQNLGELRRAMGALAPR
jgi:chitinase